MKKYINKNIIKNFIIIFSLLILSEIIFKIINNFNILDWSILRIMLSDLIISMIISCILYFIPKKIHKYIIILITFIISIYSLAQTGFNNFIGVYMSLSTSSQLGAVIDYIREFILSFKWYYYFMLIPFVVSLVYFIFFDKLVNKKFKINLNKNKYKELDKKLFIKKSLIYLSSILVILGLYISTLYIPFMQNKLQTVSNTKLFLNPSIPSVSIKQFGIAMYGTMDVKNYIAPVEEEIIYETDNEEIEKDKTRSFDDTKWNDLISNESDQTLNSLNNYFINNNISDINSYTGMFEDKNLIVIMMESVNDIFINEEDFPNFYKLYNEGWHWENNYSPRNSCATGNNEMSTMTSLYSIQNTCTANTYRKNTYFESIFNLFNNKGYRTFSAHDYTAHYYYRDEIHKNMGSGHYYDVEELGIDFSSQYKNWASDEDFMVKVLDILDTFDKDDKVMSYLTTVTSHQPYSVSCIQGDYYLDLFKDEDISMDLKRYKSKLTYLDRGLGVLINGLEERGKLDDTVIVLFGDHYPYGIAKKTINTVLDYDVTVDYEAERVPFVIYNSEMEAKTFKEYTSYINILPTIANLFNLDYDPRLYMGTDLFSEDYKSLVVFSDGSWKNELAYYDAAKGNIEYYTDKEYSVEEIQEINSMIDLKMNMSSLAIKNNYFNYLYNKLNVENNDESNICEFDKDKINQKES